MSSKYSQTDIEETRKQRDAKHKERRILTISADAASVSSNSGNYRLFCPLCNKPNQSSVSVCNCCEFPLDAGDLDVFSENIFEDILAGRNVDTKIVYRDEEIAIMNDRFPASLHHIYVVPISKIDDISHLTTKDLALIQSMFNKGVAELKRRNIPGFQNEPDHNGLNFDDHLILGFNYPPSVFYLHLHLIVPPCFNYELFGHPRWHSYNKVLKDLQTLGKVKIYVQGDTKDEAERKAYGDRAKHLNSIVTESNHRVD